MNHRTCTRSTSPPALPSLQRDNTSEERRISLRAQDRSIINSHSSRPEFISPRKKIRIASLGLTRRKPEGVGSSVRPGRKDLAEGLGSGMDTHLETEAGDEPDGQVYEPSAWRGSDSEEMEMSEDFAAYMEAVLCECVGFVQLHGRLFAVEGWSREKGQGTVS